MPSDWPDDASPRTVVVGGEGATSLSWLVPAGVVVAVESIVATVNTTAATSVPRLTIEDNTGAVITEKRQGSSIPAGSTDRATWALRLADDPGSVARAEIAHGSAAPAQSVPSGSLVVCTKVIQHESVLNEVGMTADIVSVPSRLIATVAGVYVVNALAIWNAVVATTVGYGQAVAGITGLINSQDTRRAASTNWTVHRMTHVFRMNVGSILTQQVVQNSGGPVNVSLCILAAYRIGPL